MRSRIRTALTATALTAILAVGGCAGTDAEFERTDAEAETAEEAGGGSDTSVDSGDDGEDAPEAEAPSGETISATWPDAENLVAEDVFPTRRSADQTVRIGIEAIVVKDKTMELRMVFTPEENLKKVNFYDITLNTRSKADVALIDRENLKKYYVIEAIEGGERYQTSMYATAKAGQTLGYQIFYPAPEDDIDHVDVDLGSGLPIFENVPLTFED